MWRSGPPAAVTLEYYFRNIMKSPCERVKDQGFPIALLVGLLAASLAGQTPPAAQNPAAQESPPYQFELPVPLVIEDVVVLDGNDQPVHGLKASDFILTEDGKPVTPRSLEEHAAALASQLPIKPIDLGPNVFTNLPRVAPSSSLNILLLDGLNTPIADQMFVRQQMIKFLKELDPGTRVAIFGLGTRLYLLQGFTSDPALLLSVAEGKQKAQASQVPAEEQASDASGPFSRTPGSAPAGGSVLASLQQFEAESQIQEGRLRVIYTLQALNLLARYLAALPGRKNLIWFSGSFPLSVLPDPDQANPFTAVADFENDARGTADLLARSRVAVYPIDARGLLVPGMDASQHAPTGANGRVDIHKLFPTGGDAAEHATMNVIAAQTGGNAFYNTNGLKEAIDKAIRCGENFYTLSYTPANEKWNGAWRRISIKTAQPGLHLAYRTGYFADDPNAPRPGGNKVLPQTPIQTAMLRGGPDATQVLFNVMLIPAPNPVDRLSPGADPDPKRMKPPYMSYTVQFLVDMRTMQTTVDAQGVHHGAASLGAIVYDRDGVALNTVSGRFAIDLPPDRYELALKKGAMPRLAIEAPLKGDYFLRVGIHDQTGDRVGALEVPLGALESFQQLQADAARKAQTGQTK